MRSTTKVAAINPSIKCKDKRRVGKLNAFERIRTLLLIWAYITARSSQRLLLLQDPLQKEFELSSTPSSMSSQRMSEVQNRLMAQ